MKNSNVFTLLLFLLFASSATAQTLQLDTKPDKVVQEGEVFSIDVTVSDFIKIVSCQFAVFWNPQVLQYIGVNNHHLPEVSSENLNAFAAEGKLRFNWYDQSTTVAGVTLDNETPIFTIQFKAIGGPAMSSMVEVAGDEENPVFPLEFVDDNDLVVNAVIQSGRVTIDGVNATKETVTEDFTLFQNNPNPFMTQTNISFNLNQKSNAQLSIHDRSGKVVFERNGDYGSGLHTIQVSRDLFSSAGSYFFTLKTENATATRQLVVQ